VDPEDDDATDYFDDLFPWLEDDDVDDLVHVFTGTWFTDADGDTLTYELTMSDGRRRPNWIGYSPVSGEMRGSPAVADASSLLNLKFTAYDTKEGSYSFYKSILINTTPQNKVGHVVIEASVGKYFAH